MGALFLAVSLAVFGAISCVEKTQIIQTKYGKVEGCLASNGLYYEYLGIRYAVPVRFRVCLFCQYFSFPSLII